MERVFHWPMDDPRLAARASQAAWVLVGGMVLLGMTQNLVVIAEGKATSQRVLDLLLLLLPVCGALIVNQQPRNALGWLLLFTGCVAIVGSTAEAGHWVVAQDAEPNAVAARLPDLQWPLVAPLLFATLLLRFPTGDPGSRWRPALHAGQLGVALLVVTAMTRPWDDAEHGWLRNDLPTLPERIGSALLVAGLLLVLAAALAGIARAVMRYRDPAERPRYTALILFAAATVVAIALLWAIPSLPAWVDSSVPGLVVIGFPVAITVAVLRGQISEHDVLVNRAAMVLLWRLAGVGAVLALSIAAITVLPLRAPSWLLVGIFAGAGSVAAWQCCGRAAQRRYFGMTSVEAVPHDPAALGSWAGAIRETLRVPYAELQADDGRGVSAGQRRSLPERRIDLMAGQRCLGLMVVQQRSASDPFTARDERLLELFAAQIAAQMLLERLTAEAEGSRDALAEAVAADRERLRRDLHDQLGPRLAGIRYLIAAAGPPAPGGPLDAAQYELGQAVEDVRRIAHDLAPRVVQQAGLEQALREYTERWSAATGVVVDLDLNPVPRLSPEAQTALYSVAMEAMANVERHARASRCRLRLDASADTVALEVADDGIGLPAEPPAGLGLNSMAQRAAAIGGRCRIVSEGGTKVLVEVPIHA